MALAMAVVGVTAISAAAATLSLAGSGYNTQALGSNYDLVQGAGGSISFLTGTAKNGSNGLQITGAGAPFSVTFTYIGFEAGNTNYSANIGGTIFLNKGPGASAAGASVTFSQLATGLIDFSFGTSAPAGSVGVIANNGVANPVSPNYAIGYKIISATSAFVYFDDIASGDRDFDDLVMKIDIAAVPVPAAGFLLLGALGGLAALRRRKTA